MRPEEIRAYRYQLMRDNPDWRNEKTRTFHCPHCGQFTIPKESLELKWVESGELDKDGNPVTIVAHVLSGPLADGPKCPKCKRENYELGSWMFRYGLIQVEKHTKPKKPKQPTLTFEGGIQCKGVKHG